jgi:hypothetical protein
MRRAKATPVDLAAWAQSTKENPHRQSISHRLSTHVTRQAPSAPTHSRGTSRTGSVSERGSSQPSRSSVIGPSEQTSQRRPSQAQTLRMPSERQGSVSSTSSRSNSIVNARLHTPDGTEKGDYERRSHRDEKRMNGHTNQGQPLSRNPVASTAGDGHYISSVERPEERWNSRH